VSIIIKSGSTTDTADVTVAKALKVDATSTVQPVSGTVTSNQGTSNSVANAWPILVTDGVTFASVKLASTAAIATDKALVVAISPNNGVTTTQQLDFAPATQNITVQDTASTSTAEANGQIYITGTPTVGSTASFSISSEESIEVLVTGTWTGTLSSEFSIDGGTTWFTRGIKQAGASYISSSFAANFAGGANITGATNYRVRATAAWTGTATVRVIASINITSITVTNSLSLRDSTTQSITNTIKAASTAAIATDTALVVAVSPNNSVAVTQSTTPWVCDVTQFGNNNVVTGTGASGLGIPRVTVSNDSNILATQSGSWTVAATQSGAWTTGRTWTLASGTDSVSAVQSGTWNIGTVTTITNPVAVTQSTTPWTIQGDSASGAAKAGNPVQTGGVFNTTQPTVTTGQTVEAQSTARGAQIVATGVDTFTVSANQSGTWTTGRTWALASGTDSVAAVQSGTWNIGTVTTLTSITNPVAVTQSTSPWTIQGDSASGAAKAGNPVQIGGVFNTTQPTVTTGQTVEAQSTARGAQIVATGVDTFTVAQGASNSVANAWPILVSDATNFANVKAASTAAVATDKALVVAVSPNNTVSVTQQTLTKGTQGATGVSAQELKDAGRNVTNYFMTVPVVTTATDTLQSLTGYKSNAAVGATTTPAVVTAAKTYRITAITMTYVAVTTAGTATFTLRANTGGAVAIGSPAVNSWVVGTSGATAGFTSQINVDIPDGLEFAAGTGIGISVIGRGATQTATAVGFAQINIYGFEY
jgi:hypothetical protein